MAQPDWTDVAVSDPGIGLLQLFPFLADPFGWLQRRKALLVAVTALIGVVWLLRRD